MLFIRFIYVYPCAICACFGKSLNSLMVQILYK